MILRDSAPIDWDSALLGFESTQSKSAIQEGGERGFSVHYIHEAGSFVPLVQVRQACAMALSETTDAKALMEANGGVYDIEQDPLWNGEQRSSGVPRAFDRKEMAFYQCDHLGTPQELTDHEGVVAWSAQYKAWGEAREAISEAGRRAGVRNPIRFQGQYFDEETGLHYNRFRYFDPVSGQFVSEDPIKLKGGLNLRLYAPNAVQWVDPLGLAGYTAKSNTAGTDTLSRGVHVNVHGPSLPQTPGGAHITLLPTANGLGVVPTEGSAAETADLSEKQWKKVCACVIGHLDDPKNVGRLSKQAQSGMDTYPGTPRAGELAKVKEMKSWTRIKKPEPIRRDENERIQTSTN